MNAEELITLNNKKREQLNKENLTFYEEMLVYIRTNFNKSEQQTEEILMELLDHVLEAQKEGRTAKEIFGEEPKAYCRELIGELPKAPKKKQILFISFIVFQFLGILGLVTGVTTIALYHLFDLGTNSVSISLGKGLVVIILGLLLLLSLIFVIFTWIKQSTFKERQPKKWVEFLMLWGVFTIFICLFIFVPNFIPDFGIVLTIPAYWLAISGAFFYGIHYLFRDKNSTY